MLYGYNFLKDVLLFSFELPCSTKYLMKIKPFMKTIDNLAKNAYNKFKVNDFFTPLRVTDVNEITRYKSLNEINDELSSNGYTTIEIYDLEYILSLETGKFLHILPNEDLLHVKIFTHLFIGKFTNIVQDFFDEDDNINNPDELIEKLKSIEVYNDFFF